MDSGKKSIAVCTMAMVGPAGEEVAHGHGRAEHCGDVVLLPCWPRRASLALLYSSLRCPALRVARRGQYQFKGSLGSDVGVGTKMRALVS